MATAHESDTSPVTVEDIREVTRELGPAELDHLFDNLSIPPHRVEHAKESASRNDSELQARAVLNMWRKKKGSNFTQETLFNERDKIIEKRKDKSVRINEEFNLRKCQDQLRNEYLGPNLKVQLTPWDPDHSVEMDAIFVGLELEKNEISPSQTRQIPIKRNEDLVTLKTSTGIRINRILVLGEPGSGKSTLLNNIAYKWALQLDSSQSSDSPLSQFDLVFIINIHEIDDINSTLEEIIFNQMLEECPNVSQSSLKSYLMSNAQRCLFLVDGLNEDSVGILTSTAAVMSRLLYNKMYKQSCVIASIRPYKLQTMGRNQGIFTKVRLTGFSSENILTYINRYFADTNINYAELLQRLKEEPHVWDLAGTPLLLLFFCLLWNDPDNAERSLPNTRTKLYQETITSLWKRYHFEKRGLSEEDVVSYDLQKKLIKFLEVLGHVTLERLIDDPHMEQVLFENGDFEATTFSLAMEVGLLTKERIRSKHIITSVKFLHTSIQDFCSAVYLSNLQTRNNEKCKEYISNLMHPEWTPSKEMMNDVLIFCAGCRSETMNLIANQLLILDQAYLSHIYQSASDEGRLYQIDHDYVILPEYIPSDTVTATYKGKRVKFDSTSVRSREINILFIAAFEAQLTLEQCNEIASILQSVNYPLGLSWMLDHNFDKCIRYHLNLLRSANDTNTGLFFSTLSVIMFSYPPIEFPLFYSMLVSILRYTKQLYYLHLNFKCVLAPNQVSHLSDMFDTLASLEHLHILRLKRDYSDSNTHGDVDITNSLNKICHLKLNTIKLINVTVTATAMAEFLRSSTTLKHLLISTPYGSSMSNTFNIMKVISNMQALLYLTLGGVTIGRDVKHLTHKVGKLKSLRFMRLAQPSFGIWDVHELASFLNKAKNLTTLYLGDICLDTALGHLADQLKHMVNLKDMGLSNTGMKNHGCQILADGIQTMSSLCSLTLTNNKDIGLAGRLAVENLRTRRQFNQLEIEWDPIIMEAYMLQEQAPQQYQTAIDAALYLYTEASPRLVSRLRNQLRVAELQDIEDSQTPNLPGCCSCMSQIYNGVRCKLSSTKSSKQDEHNISKRVSDVLVNYSRLPVKRFKPNQSSSEQERVQTSFLPNCCSCMSQVYNDIKCKNMISQMEKLEKSPDENSRQGEYKTQASSGQEVVQTLFLPDCCSCMCQIYNDVTCKISLQDQPK